jgi:hypothetical protein
MDFGFDGFLEKFEQHFGRGLTKALLLLIGLAITAACLGVIWQYLISPILAFFQVPGRSEMIAKIAVAGSTVMAGALVALRLYDWYLGRRIDRSAEAREALADRMRATEAVLDALERDRREKLKRSRELRDKD